MLARVLHERKLAYQMLSETEAEIYADMSVTELVLMLAQEHCEVLSYREQDESLESYYVKLVGGAVYE